MNHGIGQRLLQGEFNGIFLAVDALHVADSLHHLRHDRIHGLPVSRERDSHAQTQPVWIEGGPRRVFLGRSPSFHGWLDGPVSARGARPVSILVARLKSRNGRVIWGVRHITEPQSSVWFPPLLAILIGAPCSSDRKRVAKGKSVRLG